MKRESSKSGAISIRNLQRKIAFDRTALEQFALRALRLCRQQPGAGLTNREEIGVLVVSDRKIADLHRRFMKIAGPTDVITFQHGEIFISAETARRHARAFGNSLLRELKLYIVHGLLHLHGFDDHTAGEADKMKAAQERILGMCSGTL